MRPEIWLAISLIMIVFEAATVGLVCIWFAVGAFITFLVSLVIGNIYIQGVVFLAVSVISFISLRPFLGKFMPINKKTNSTLKLIGEKAVVTEEITPMGGRVKVGDISWMAESSNGSNIEVNSLVKITESKSNKLIVEKI